ncbi:MAG TPA: nucleotidyltransferase substrate binding protein [Candidatus Blautia faecigallinarum]|uniref:Nucleotidyltransferase substrate binding protein n=1 Tax=Candidatus Blautia faecigallinarum TaxID=2838488 RepID=A0A9D2DQY9_9FIRM|nr:nucleotidyltransferase substrate binding protein [Candidatus Blautia faecigallinarum]
MDEKIWLEMLKARNDMSHIYDGGAAKKLVDVILTKYIPEFLKLQANIQKVYGDILEEM